MEKEIEIDLDNILSNYVFENDVDTLSLRAMICYEGHTQKEEELKLLVKRNGTTSVTSISLTTTAHRSTTTSTDSASPHPPTNASSILRGETERRR